MSEKALEGCIVYIGIDMYKFFNFLLEFFLIKNTFSLRIFGRSFRISPSKKFLTSYHVSKLKFSSKFLENWPLHHELDLPRFLNISIMIEQSFLRKVIKRSRFGRFWKKSYGVLKISRVTSGLAKVIKTCPIEVPIDGKLYNEFIFDYFKPFK